MFIDHIGVLLFPDVAILRIIGRLAFPIYAYLIGEGCIYTKNKWKYLRNVGITFICFQIIAELIDKNTGICVLFGFSLFIIFTIIMDWARKNMNQRMIVPLLYSLFVGVVLTIFETDYIFFSLCLPMVPYFFKDKKILKIITYTGLLLLLGSLYQYQFYGLFAMIPLILHNGQKGRLNGKGKMKYLFYLFYPLHYLFLGVLQFLFFR
jgi:hypothetical protein